MEPAQFASPSVHGLSVRERHVNERNRELSKKSIEKCIEFGYAVALLAYLWKKFPDSPENI